MPDSPEPPLPQASIPRWDSKLVFSKLADPTDRRLLQLLADGRPHTVTGMAGTVRRTGDATLKHLNALCAAHFVHTKPDPVKPRRQLYMLNPAIPVRKTEAGREIDFGCCTVRC